MVEIPHSQIEPAPSFGTGLRSDFIKGITTVDSRFVVMLDVQQALSIDELTQLADEVGRAHLSEHVTTEGAG